MPIINDPRNGAIAPDQFLAYVKKADGTPWEPDFVARFNSLQATGQVKAHAVPSHPSPGLLR